MVVEDFRRCYDYDIIFYDLPYSSIMIDWRRRRVATLFILYGPSLPEWRLHVLFQSVYE